MKWIVLSDQYLWHLLFKIKENVQSIRSILKIVYGKVIILFFSKGKSYITSILCFYHEIIAKYASVRKKSIVSLIAIGSFLSILRN